MRDIDKREITREADLICEDLHCQRTVYITILRIIVIITNKIFVAEDQNEGKTKVASIYRIPIYSLVWTRCMS